MVVPLLFLTSVVVLVMAHCAARRATTADSGVGCAGDAVSCTNYHVAS